MNSSFDCDIYSYCGTSQFSCNELNATLPDLKIRVGDIIYSLPANAYTEKGFDGHDSGCSLLIGKMMDEQNDNSRDYDIVLGLAFLR